MAAGKFKCLGSNQHLKTKFGVEYLLEFKTKEGFMLDELILEVMRILPVSTTVDERIDGFVRLRVQRIPSENVVNDDDNYQNETSFDLAVVFDFIENNKDRLGVVSYSISQATLEQIFVQIAKKMSTEADGCS